MSATRILVSGAGIAGLTFATELKRRGFSPVVIEREPGLRAEGYMMDFFGTGWDVAERMGLIEHLRALHYPIQSLEFVNADGEAYVHMPIERLRRALDDKYVYLRRQDLESILAERAHEMGVEVCYATSTSAIDQRSNHVRVRFTDGGEDEFALVVGADGMHSRVRELAFGAESQFARFLGLYAAAFHVLRAGFPIGNEIKLYEETDRLAFIYPLDDSRMDATYMFRHGEINPRSTDRLGLLRESYRGAGWIAGDVLAAYVDADPLFFDSLTQIVMPRWYCGRVALIGDACGCLTPIAAQGSHMAMAGGYLLAQELARHRDHRIAFAAYENFLKPHVERRQRDARRLARIFVPTARSRPWLRRLVLRLMFSGPLMRYGLAAFGTASVLSGRAR